MATAAPNHVDRGGLDPNRVGHQLALLGLLAFWGWFFFYLLLQYVPFGGGFDDGTQAYKAKAAEWADKLCPVDKDGAAYNGHCVWYYPGFFAFTLAAVAARKLSIHPHRPKGLAGDWDMTLLFYVAVAAPMIVYWALLIKTNASPKDSFDDTPEGRKEYIVEMMNSLAKRSGYLGLWPLSFFMIPASKHAPVLALLNWHPFHAMTIHMWCGRLAFFGSVLHFVFFIIKYAVRGTYNGFNPAQFIFPARVCFNVLETKEIPGDCSMMLNGFFGTLGIFFFALLIGCSIKYVRRHHFMVFYASHIICAPFFLIFLVMHWKNAHYYLWPSMFYYAAAHTPFILQHWRNTINSYGVKVNQVVDIPCREALTEGGLPEPKKRSWFQKIFFVDTADWLEEQLFKRGPTAKSCQHCVCFDWECTREAMEQYVPGVYANIFVPDMSIKSHPFTVMHIPGKPTQCRIVFRVFGKFTDLLARSLIRLVEPTVNQEYLPIPKIMVDGWHGVDTFEEAVNHDKAVLIAAGIGITAHMALFCELVEVLCFQKEGLFTKRTDIKGTPVTKEVTLHWMCRDENLIKFITDEYFAPMLARASEAHASRDFSNEETAPARCRIVIHRTGPLKSKDVHESSLWKSFVEKDIDGPTNVDYTALGTYGSPWLPSRFTFGRHETFLGCLPPMLMFLAIFWFSYWFTFQMSVWISKNPFGFKGVVQNLSWGWICVPSLIVAFGFALLGHNVLDWRDNVESSKLNEERRELGVVEWDAKFEQLEEALSKNSNHTIDTLISSATSEEERSLYRWAAAQHKNKTLDLSNRMKLESLKINWDDKAPIPAKEPEIPLPEQPMSAEIGSRYLTLASKGGRPSSEQMLSDCEEDCLPGCEFKPISTGIFLCGPERMIEDAKKAAGAKFPSHGVKVQNFVHKNKFVIYEERFEW